MCQSFCPAKLQQLSPPSVKDNLFKAELRKYCAEIHSNRLLIYQSLVTVPSTVYKPGEFTEQVRQVSGKRRAS